MFNESYYVVSLLEIEQTLKEPVNILLRKSSFKHLRQSGSS